MGICGYVTGYQLDMTCVCIYIYTYRGAWVLPTILWWFIGYSTKIVVDQLDVIVGHVWKWGYTHKTDQDSISTRDGGDQDIFGASRSSDDGILTISGKIRDGLWMATWTNKSNDFEKADGWSQHAMNDVSAWQDWVHPLFCLHAVDSRSPYLYCTCWSKHVKTFLFIAISSLCWLSFPHE